MASYSSMPGAFPSAELIQATANANAHAAAAAQAADAASRTLSGSPSLQFDRMEKAAQKGLAQHHIVKQLNTLTFFLIGYQFVRFCYSLCLPPLFFHVLIQGLLNVNEIINQHRGHRALFSDALAVEERNAEATGTVFDSANWLRLLVLKLALFVYWKFVIVVLWHTVFVAGWMQQVAGAGHLADLSLGSWYCLLFIGEQGPLLYSPHHPLYVRLWQLGLVELVALDAAILVLQLVLFQSIYYQSTVSPLGIPLGDEEVDILRAHTAGSGTVPTDCRGIPDVFHIRLFHMFERELFTA